VIWFEFMFALAVAWRMRFFEDLFAVVALNGAGIYINTQYQLRGTPGAQSLGLHLAYMLTSLSIAIAFAIPFQLLIFPTPAREELRYGLASIMRTMARIAIEQVELSGAVFHLEPTPEHAKALEQDSERLQKEFSQLRDGLRRMGQLTDSAAAEWALQDGFHPRRARAHIDALYRCADAMASHVGLASVGLVDPRVRALVTAENDAAARAFAETASTVLWCLAASLTLLESPPAALPSIDLAGQALMNELQKEASGLQIEDKAIEVDVRRMWALTLSLVTQQGEMDLLIDAMRPGWKLDLPVQSADEESSGRKSP